jgi:hypothetical protein
VYAYRTRKAGAFLRVPFVSFHWGYVGQTRNPGARHGEHVNGGGRYGKPGSSFGDLEPRRYVLFRMNNCPQWLLNGAEFFWIKVLLPVYNEKMNRPNPRRVSRKRAIRARARRDAGLRWTPLPTFAHLLFFVVFLAMVLGYGAR